MKTLSPIRALALGLVCIIFALPARGTVATDQMAAAANKLLATLDAPQAAKATFELKADERLNWHYIPKIRKGLTLKEMTDPQRQLARALLASGLSQQGFRKATNIMNLELILRELESKDPRMVRDPELYYFSIFGKPGAKETWGWRVEGHHLSVNFTMVAGQAISGTPSFMGTNPAEVKEGPQKGWRVLAGEEDLGRQLVKALTEEQRKIAVIETTAPKEILTAADRTVKALAAAGIAQDQLTKPQAEMLLRLVREYLSRNRPDMASEELRKIRRAGLDKIRFAWAGGLERGEGHYYRVQGPTFLLEYDNTQNNNNHIHAVWRDYENDFGGDILAKHYAESPHP